LGLESTVIIKVIPNPQESEYAYLLCLLQQVEQLPDILMLLKTDLEDEIKVETVVASPLANRRRPLEGTVNVTVICGESKAREIIHSL
jgi:hypothetical protein